jgi:hypothetical protein
MRRCGSVCMAVCVWVARLGCVSQQSGLACDVVLKLDWTDQEL